MERNKNERDYEGVYVVDVLGKVGVAGQVASFSLHPKPSVSRGSGEVEKKNGELGAN